MVNYPLDPPLAKLVCTGVDLECGIESITIVAVLAVGGMQQVFFTPLDRAKEASEAHNHLLILDSDHLSLLNVFEEVKSAIVWRAPAPGNFVHRASVHSFLRPVRLFPHEKAQRRVRTYL
jgi:HrpA-like RNA helicase